MIAFAHFHGHLPRVVLCCLGLAGSVAGQVVVQQDFSAGGNAASYFSATPGAGQLSGLQLTRSLAGDLTIFSPPVISQSDGVADAAISGGALRINLQHAYAYYFYPFISDHTAASNRSSATVTVRSGGTQAGLTRTWLQCRVQLSSGNATRSPEPARLSIFNGQNVLNLVHDGGTRIAQGSFVASDTVLLTVAVNRSGAAQTYAAPDGTAATVAHGSHDVWINDSLRINDGPHTATDLRTVSLSVDSGLSVSGIFPVSPVVGAPTVFVLDDVLLRRDFPAPPPADLDRDGVPDFAETYFGTAPATPTPVPWSVTRSGAVLTLRWPESAPAGVTVVPEWSPDLETWLASGATANGIPARVLNLGPAAAGQRQVSLDATGLTRAWLRLRLTSGS